MPKLSFYYKHIIFITGLLFLQVFMLELLSILSFILLKNIFAGFEIIRVIVLWQIIVFLLYLSSILASSLIIRALQNISTGFRKNNYIHLVITSLLIPLLYLFGLYQPLFGHFDWEFNENTPELLRNLLLGCCIILLSEYGWQWYHKIKMFISK